MRWHISSIAWPWPVRLLKRYNISSVSQDEASFFSQVSCHTKCQFFSPFQKLQQGLFASSPSLCKYLALLIENNQSVDSPLWSLGCAPLQYLPPQSGHLSSGYWRNALTSRHKMALNLCIIYASFTCSGPLTIYQMPPHMSKHGNWVPLLMILAANTSVDRESLEITTHCHSKVSTRQLSGSSSFLGTLHNMMQHGSAWVKAEDTVSPP